MVTFEERFFCSPPSVYELDSSLAYVALPKESLRKHQPKPSPEVPIGLTLDHLLSDAAWFKNYTQKVNISSDTQKGKLKSKFSSDSWKSRCLDNDILDYYRFLALVYLYPVESKGFHPSYFTDLMWHVHQLRPVIYKKDCEDFYGAILDHDPWPEKSEEMSAQEERSMKGLWEETFNVKYCSLCDS